MTDRIFPGSGVNSFLRQNGVLRGLGEGEVKNINDFATDNEAFDSKIILNGSGNIIPNVIGQNGHGIRVPTDTIGQNGRTIGQNGHGIRVPTDTIGQNGRTIGQNGHGIRVPTDTIGYNTNANAIGHNGHGIRVPTDTIGQNGHGIRVPTDTIGQNGRIIGQNGRIIGQNGHGIRVPTDTIGHNGRTIGQNGHGIRVPTNDKCIFTKLRNIISNFMSKETFRAGRTPINSIEKIDNIAESFKSKLIGANKQYSSKNVMERFCDNHWDEISLVLVLIVLFIVIMILTSITFALLKILKVGIKYNSCCKRETDTNTSLTGGSCYLGNVNQSILF